MVDSTFDITMHLVTIGIITSRLNLLMNSIDYVMTFSTIV